MMITEWWWWWWCYARIGVKDLSSRIRRQIRSKQLSWFNACAQQLTSNPEARPKSLKFTVAQDTLHFPSAVYNVLFAQDMLHFSSAVHNVLFVQYVTFSLCSVAPTVRTHQVWDSWTSVRKPFNYYLTVISPLPPFVDFFCSISSLSRYLYQNA